MFLFRLLGRLVGGLVNLVLWLALIAVIVGGLLIVGPSFGIHTERLDIPSPVSSVLSGVETAIPSVLRCVACRKTGTDHAPCPAGGFLSAYSSK